MGHANLKFWTAREHDDIEPIRQGDSDKRTLIVAGKVEVEGEAPVLEEHVRLDGKRGILYLKFRTLTEGNSWKPVWFQKEIRSGDYDEVQLLIPSGDEATGGHLRVEKSPIKATYTESLKS
jgi:hypothetical protein